MLLRRGRRGLWWLLLRAAACRACLTDADVLFVLDRSVSIGQDNWNDAILDFLDAQVARLAPSEETDVRVGVVVGAVAAAIASAVRGGRVHGDGESCANTGADNDGDCECDPRGGGWTAYGGYDLGPSNSSLSWPCGGWRWTPTWHALDVARTTLDDARGANKSTYVYLITDGAPANTMSEDVVAAEKTHRFKRPVHLTLEAASALKAWIAAHGGGALRGVGVGDKWTDLGSNCDPFCDEQGMGLFVGQGYTGSVNMTYFDDSALYCDEAYDDHPFGCADGALAANCDQLWAIEDLVGENFLAEFGAVLCGTGEFSWDYPTAAPTPAVACGDGGLVHGASWDGVTATYTIVDDTIDEDGTTVVGTESGARADVYYTCVPDDGGSCWDTNYDYDAADATRSEELSTADGDAIVRDSVDPSERDAVLVPELDAVCRAIALSERDAVLVPELFAVRRAVRFVASADGDAGRSDSLTGARANAEAIAPAKLCSSACADASAVASADGDAGRSDSITGSFSDAEAVAAAELGSSACADARPSPAPTATPGDPSAAPSDGGASTGADARGYSGHSHGFTGVRELVSDASANSRAFAGAPAVAPSPAPTASAALLIEPTELYVVTVRLDFDADDVAACGADAVVVGDSDPLTSDVVRDILNLTSPSSTLDLRVRSDTEANAASELGSGACADAEALASADGYSRKPVRSARFFSDAKADAASELGSGACANAETLASADVFSRESDSSTCFRSDAEAYAASKLGSSARADAAAISSTHGDSRKPIDSTCFRSDAEAIAAAELGSSSWANTAAIASTHSHARNPSAARKPVRGAGSFSDAEANAPAELRSGARADAPAIAGADGDARKPVRITGARSDAEANAPAELRSGARADAPAIAGADGDARKPVRITGARSDAEANAPAELRSGASAAPGRRQHPP
ncbi:hypothetical protein JL720_9975 [Aureococcus anophagefferens]|nr:hypothetical protein JL720_9975 [Aureococcus anophagefferens]